MTASDQPAGEKKIVVRKNGPYRVHGGIPLVHKVQVVSEYGEPLTWQKLEIYETPGDPYFLCRCGHSANKPFCDGTHKTIAFDGSETADTNTTAERRMALTCGAKLVVRRDGALCMESGFCGNRFTNVEKLLRGADDSQVCAQVIAMIERCPSGSYSFSMEEDGPDIEPDLPVQIAVTEDVTAAGPVIGALWVTGRIPVERADGRPFETRNRVTLCRCGLSRCKPLCDGAHRGLEPLKRQD